MNTIPGIWPTSFNHRKNVNFYAFQDALSRGLSPEQAIFETPQGKIMKKFCFTKCVFGKDNSPPDYKNGVEVYFNRE